MKYMGLRQAENLSYVQLQPPNFEGQEGVAIGDARTR